jgi:ABC-type amino acid transport substrate-binding protein
MHPRHHAAAVLWASVVAAAMPLAIAQSTSAAGTLQRIRESGKIRLGYRVDARPFSYTNEAGGAVGYAVALCRKVADDLKSDLNVASLAVEWVPVSVNERFRAAQQNKIDLLCSADTVTLGRRSEVAFSIPIFPGGIGVLTRADAPVRLREVLAGRGQTFQPTWRARAGQALQSRAFSAVSGTTAEKWLAETVKQLQVIADVVPVGGYDAGVNALVERRSDALFGERAILMDAARRHASSRDLTVVDRLFTFEPLALAMGRGDDDFRLAVDRALSRVYRSGEIGGLYTDVFGEPDANALTFFRWNALPD